MQKGKRRNQLMQLRAEIAEMQSGHLKQDINQIQVPYHRLHKTKQNRKEQKHRDLQKYYCTSDEKRKVSAKILGNKKQKHNFGKAEFIKQIRKYYAQMYYSKMLGDID